jgi:DNA-binding transcriptional MerR regulator
MQIGEASRQAGVSRQSVQYYLMVGLIEPDDSTKGGRRLFGKESIEKIKLIKKLNDSGYPLRAIRDIFMDRESDKS